MMNCLDSPDYNLSGSDLEWSTDVGVNGFDKAGHTLIGCPAAANVD